ncbi:MAG: sterol desaturase family protein [Raineya sp.]
MNIILFFVQIEKTAQFIALFVFFALLFVELWISFNKNLKLFDKKDTFVNLSLGILTSITKIAIKALTIVYFQWLGQWKIWEIPINWWSILLLILANDLIFYWYHRLSHESRFFWAMHVAHHSSTILNTSTAVRGNFLHFLYRFVFWSPLALLGFDPFMIVLIDEIGFYYQMYIHTEIFKKFPSWFEFIFNTPSHHRVHHASNPEYIDKNYGAVFIIWDRIFATFAPEINQPQYGITKNQPKKNDIWNVITHELIAIGTDLKKARNFKTIFKVVFGRP